VRLGREYLEVVRRAGTWLGEHVADVLVVALAVAIFVEIAVTTAPIDGRIEWPLSPFWALPLLFRRRFPLQAPLLCIGALALSVALDPPGSNDLSTPFLAVLAATMAIGVIASRKQALAGLAIVAAMLAYVISAFPNTKISDYLWVGVVAGCTWLAGFVLARRTHQATELRARAEQAEQDREEQSRLAVEEERARISRELHDVIAHTVSVMVVQTGAVRRLLKPEQERERESLVVVEEIGREALTEMRRLLGILREPEEADSLAPQPTLDRVDALVEQIREAGLPVEVSVEGDVEPLPPGVDLCAFRIVQEALTNSLKHAGPAHAEVHLRYGGDELELEVVDDGRGANGQSNGGGQGLLGMKERALLCGGSFETGAGPAGGFAVRARLPIHGAAS
jgi:signal transduction histidine kinase